MKWRLHAAALLLAAALPSLGAPPARAGEAPAGTWNFIIENDSIQSDSDRHYTHGTRFSYLCAPPHPALPRKRGRVGEGEPGDDAAPCGLAGAFAGRLPGGLMQHPLLDLEFGQSIFTPTDIHIADPDRSDRPYGAWLYVGASLIDEKNGAGLDRLGLQVGLVGPDALGQEIQNTWHQFIGARRAVGWDQQIHDEPGLVLSAERKLRFVQPLGAGYAVDVIPEVKGALGNVFTYGAVGAMARIGRNIGFDYGPPRIEPALSGTDWFKPTGGFGWYLFIGNEDRVVGRDIFLDGNTFRSSRHVPRNILVADLETGAALVYSDWLRLAYSFVVRTPEFHGQTEGPDEFSAVTLSLRF